MEMQTEPTCEKPQACNPTSPTNMVFEGGGVLGCAYIGVIEELHTRGMWQHIKCFAGASIGAITSIICACRPSIKQITDTLISIDIERMLDKPCWPRAAYNLVAHRGICPGDYALAWLREQLSLLSGNADITLGILEDKFDTKLVVCVLNITKRRLEYITGKTHPTCSVALLGRAAMSISALYIPVDLFNNGDLYVDGGMLNNYPIQCFHYQSSTADIINPNTIGAMLFSDADAQVDFPPIGGVIDYGLIHLNLLWNWPQKQHMDDQDWARTIKVRTGTMSSLNFKITRAQVDDLIARGRDGVRDWCALVHVPIQAPFLTTHTRADEEPQTIVDL